MRKLLCLLMAILLIGTIALAESIDLSALSDDELLALKEQVDQSVSDRGLIKEFELGAGLYIGGRDIKPGSYTLIISEKTGSFRIGINKDDKNLDTNEGLLYTDNIFGVDPGVELPVNISINDGNVMVIKCDGTVKLLKNEIIG